MSTLGRPSKQCIHPGCRTTVLPGNSRCQQHLAQQQAARFNTPTKQTNPKHYHTKEYHRERTAVLRERGHCHLTGHGPCNGPLHTHHTVDGTHHRNTLAPLCQRHHMQLEAQGKHGALATQLAHIMRMMGLNP
jgi:hypothetical protein